MTVVAHPRSSSRPATRIILAFVTVILIWGSTWMVIRGQLGIVDPTWSVCYRFLIGGAAIFAYAAAIRQRLLLDARGLGFAAVLGCLQCWLNFLMVYHAERYLTSGVVALAFSLQLVPNAILARLFVGVPIGRAFAIGAAISVVGMVLLFWQEAANALHGGDKVLLGLGLGLLGLLSASVSNTMQASARGRVMPPLPTLAWAMIFGAAANAIVAIVTVGPPTIDPQPAYLLGLLYLGLGSALTFPIFYFLINQLGPGRAAYSGVVVPVFAMLLSTLIEGYRWSALGGAGAALALVGLVIAVRGRVAGAGRAAPAAALPAASLSRGG